MNLSNREWKYFHLTGDNGIFDIDNCKCSNASKLLEDGNDIQYIGAKKSSNGLMRTVKYNDQLVTKGNCIVLICDGQGSVGYTNYMEFDFIGSTTLSVGYNDNLNRYNAMFLVTILDLERYRYSYGRKYRSNLSKVKIKLPATKEGKPDWDFMTNYIKSRRYKKLKTKNTSLNVSIDVKGWGKFRLEDLFDQIYRGETNVKADLKIVDYSDENSMALVTRTAENNGIDCYVDIRDVNRVEKGNALTIGDTTATIFYQPNRFVTGDHMVVCRAKWLNQYTGLFVKTILDQENYRYNYGRAFKTEIIKETYIKLPIKEDGTPDWLLMEEIIKSYSYGDRL